MRINSKLVIKLFLLIHIALTSLKAMNDFPSNKTESNLYLLATTVIEYNNKPLIKEDTWDEDIKKLIARHNLTDTVQKWEIELEKTLAPQPIELSFDTEEHVSLLKKRKSPSGKKSSFSKRVKRLRKAPDVLSPLLKGKTHTTIPLVLSHDKNKRIRKEAKVFSATKKKDHLLIPASKLRMK